MAHELECKNGVWSFVFAKEAGPGWHNKGTEADSNVSTEDWREFAGHNFTVSARPVLYRGKDGTIQEMPNRVVNARDDNDHALGVVSTDYKLVQNSEVDDICDSFAAMADGQLVRSAAFTLRRGDMICSTYAYRGDGMTIAGDRHNVHLMAATRHDGKGSTQFWASVIRAVCKNTIEAGLGSSKAIVSVRHTAKLDPDRVREQLAELAQSVLQYKELGDALAKYSMSKAQISAFFKEALDIPADATKNDKGEIVGTSTRKFNQFADLSRAFMRSVQERGGSMDAFTALQAVTRYVDHDRSVKASSNGDETIARFDSANFGSGAALKNKAAGLLLPMINAKVAA